MNVTEQSGIPTPAPAQRRGWLRRWWPVPAIALLVLLSAATWRLTKDQSKDPSSAAATTTPAKGARGQDANRPVPVSTQLAAIQPNFEVLLGALGTVTARNTVTVHVRVDGELVQVAFREGQTVRIGDLLAVIDPRPFQVALENAAATLEKDKAQLANAEVDQERYRALIADDSIPKQQYDSQVALVQQDKALVLADQAQVDNAKLQLSFTRVISPINGRVGLRQVDLGNVVHAADTNGLVVITQVQPIDIVFPIPQEQLPAVQRRIAAGAKLQVDAYDSDGKTLLSTGTLLTTDNQIDTTTGTVKLKAEFANRDSVLFPNQFVNVRLHLQKIDDALTIPSAAVQRGAPGLYAYVVKADNTVQIRPLKTGPTEGDRVQILDGLAANDRVVVDGVDKLREGAPVELIDPSARSATAGHVHRNAGSADAGKKASGSSTGTP
jgi:membrane fusion protein, multidrug efflux system